MDFVTGLPKTRLGLDAIWVIMDKLTKYAHFLQIKEIYKMVDLYIREIVKFHGIPTSIVSDRDPRFTFRFWRSFQQAFGSKLSFIIAYHPLTNG